mgnify:CR=1 FL=1
MPSEVGPRGRVLAHLALTKPRIIELLLVTALPTMFLAAHGLPTLQQTIAVLVGGALSAGGANTLNSVYDRDIDAKMRRTGHRPAASGAVSARAGVIQGVFLSVLSAALLLWLANLLAALLALLAIALYVFGYTMWLKRRTPQNIVWGGIAGCMPVLIAWATVTGTLSPAPFALFLIVFFWTPPHYWPLAMKYRDDYATAGVPMAPVVWSDAQVTRSMVMYTWGMVLASLALIPLGPMTWFYSAVAVAAGAVFLVLVHRFQRLATAGVDDIGAPAMRIFHWSITYLSIIFLAVAIDPFLH